MSQTVHRGDVVVVIICSWIYHLLVDDKAKILPCNKTEFCLE